MGTKRLGYLASGEPVYDSVRLHSNPVPFSELIDGLSTVRSGKSGIIVKEIYFDHIIGETYCVKTQEGDDVYYAKKFGEKEWFRFVRNRKPEPSNILTVILSRSRDRKEFTLVHRFIGDKGETNPSLESSLFYNMDNFIKSVDYWDHHAFIDGSKEIDISTITAVCPWQTTNGE